MREKRKSPVLGGGKKRNEKEERSGGSGTNGLKEGLSGY